MQLEFFSEKREDEYFVFHDESKHDSQNQSRYIHGFLLIPCSTAKKLYKRIREIRLKYKANGKFHYTDLSGRKESGKSRAIKDILYVVGDGMNAKRYTRKLWGDPVPGIKFIMFNKKNPDKLKTDFYNHGTEDKKEIKMRKIETLFRIGLKGGLHYFFEENHKIEIVCMFTDGQGEVRPYDPERILNRLKTELVEHVTFNEKAEIVPIPVQSKVLEYSLEEEMLQVCDCLLGAFIQGCCEDEDESVKYKTAKPIIDIIKKKQTRGGNFVYSGHYRSYALTRAILNNNKWDYLALDLLKKSDKSFCDEMF